MIRATLTGLAQHDTRLEQAARSLGAGPLTTFRRITLPLLTPAILSRAVFVFVVSFDDVAVALLVGGADAVTLPMQIYTSVEFDFDTGIMAVSTLVMIGTLLALAGIDRLVGVNRIADAGRT